MCIRKLDMKVLLPQTPLAFVAGVIGGLLFTLVQVVFGVRNIADFIGKQIVALGGYSEGLALPLGWGIHLAISVQYAFLLMILLHLVSFPTKKGNMIFGLSLSLFLGWITTVISGPAISITISFLQVLDFQKNFILFI